MEVHIAKTIKDVNVVGEEIYIVVNGEDATTVANEFKEVMEILNKK